MKNTANHKYKLYGNLWFKTKDIDDIYHYLKRNQSVRYFTREFTWKRIPLMFIKRPKWGGHFFEYISFRLQPFHHVPSINPMQLVNFNYLET